MEIFLTDTAVSDLLSIGDWIAADSPARALEFVELLRARCLQLGEYPLAFPVVPRFKELEIRRRTARVTMSRSFFPDFSTL